MCSGQAKDGTSSKPPSPGTQCKVCGFDGHGIHFGVVTCRACAAFFRRFIVLNLKYKCLKNKTRCSLDKIRRSSCRHCRFQKCLQMGMTADNVQWHRDINAAETQFKRMKPRDICEEDTDPTMPGPSNPKINQLVNIKAKDHIYKPLLPVEEYGSLEEEARRVFEYELCSTINLSFSRPLMKFVEGLKLIRVSQKVNDIVFENRLTMKTLSIHWKAQANRIAVLMMHCLSFRNFSLEGKHQIFRSLWKSVYRLERIQMSVQLFEEECISEKIFVISTERAIQLDDLFFDFEGLHDHRLESILQSFLGFAEQCIKQIAGPLHRLKLSIEEQAFMILIFIFHDEEYIPKEYSAACSNFLDSICDELHHYYRKNEVKNYAPRMTDILKIVKEMRKIHHDDHSGVFANQPYYKKRHKD